MGRPPDVLGGERLAEAKLEDGYSRLAHAITEALCRSRVPGNHLRVMMAIVRLTFGWQKASDRIGGRQIGGLCDLDPSHVRRILRDLVQLRMIRRGEAAPGCTPELGIETNTELWLDPAARDEGPVQGDLFAQDDECGDSEADRRVPAPPGRGSTGGRAVECPPPRAVECPPPKKGKILSKETQRPAARAAAVCVSLESIWPEVQKAFATYGVDPPAELTEPRRRLLAARLAEHPDRGPEILVHAVHGFWASAAPPSKSWNPRRACKLRAIFKPVAFSDYVEAYDAELRAGRQAPFMRLHAVTGGSGAAPPSRRETFQRLYNRGWLASPDEAGFRAWEAAGRPQQPSWWAGGPMRSKSEPP